MIATTMLALALTFAGEPKADAPKPYTFDTSATKKQAQVGKGGTVELKITAAEGHYISADAPLKIALKAEGLELAKESLGHGDAKDAKSKTPEFSVAYKAPAPGDKSVAIDATFFVCSEKICERKTEKVSLPIAVRN